MKPLFVTCLWLYYRFPYFLQRFVCKFPCESECFVRIFVDLWIFDLFMIMNTLFISFAEISWFIITILSSGSDLYIYMKYLYNYSENQSVYYETLHYMFENTPSDESLLEGEYFGEVKKRKGWVQVNERWIRISCPRESEHYHM